MHKYSSYLLERIYEKDFTKNINTAKYNYWNNLLGEDNWKQILQEYPKVHCYLRDEKFSCFLPDNDIFLKRYRKKIVIFASLILCMIEKFIFLNFIQGCQSMHL